MGLELPRNTATLPENKNKNRFSNVLACECLYTKTYFMYETIIIVIIILFVSSSSDDCSRVRLSIDDEGDSDYINANYMPVSFMWYNVLQRLYTAVKIKKAKKSHLKQNVDAIKEQNFD